MGDERLEIAFEGCEREGKNEVGGKWATGEEDCELRVTEDEVNHGEVDWERHFGIMIDDWGIFWEIMAFS